MSKVMLVCEKCGKPARIAFRFLDDGKKVRICNSCQEVID
jgi:large subunit ribosomal protein L24